MNSTSAISLDLLPFPGIVETLDFEVILAEMLADLQARDPAFSALVESDPAYKILEVAAYREVLLRQRVNDATKGVMLAYAIGSDLDQIGGNFAVERLVVDPGDPDAIPPVPPTMESDAAFRKRIQLAFESITTAGSYGSYLYHALGADGRVKDVGVEGPELEPGRVYVAVLSSIGSGLAPDDLLTAVREALNDDEVRPLTDDVVVQSASIVEYSVLATIKFFPGPDRAVVMATAQASIEAYAADQHRCGRDITLSGIYRALHQEGVQNVVLTQPMASLVIGPREAGYCTGITLIDGGVDE